jgi:hypothetical protein
MTTRMWILVWCLAAELPSQQNIVVARSKAGIAGFGVPERQQLIIDAAHLQGALGRSLTAISFRRDAQYQDSLASAQAQVVVRIGVSQRSSSSPSSTLSDNLTSATEVFRGVATVPPSPAVSGPTDWSSSNILRIGFTTPFPYSGGDLCIEITGTPVGPGGVFWPVDAVQDGVVGTVNSVGLACGAYVAANGTNHSLAPSELVLGNTAHFISWGTPNAPAFLLLGFSTLETPIDLSDTAAKRVC